MFTFNQNHCSSSIRIGVHVPPEYAQVEYLKQVIASQQKITTAIAEITEARLSLEGQCQDDKKAPLAQYLRKVENVGGD